MLVLGEMMPLPPRAPQTLQDLPHGRPLCWGAGYTVTPRVLSSAPRSLFHMGFDVAKGWELKQQYWGYSPFTQAQLPHAPPSSPQGTGPGFLCSRGAEDEAA